MAQQQFRIQRNPDDDPLKGSIRGYEKFLRSFEWKDIRGILEQKREDAMRGALEAENMDQVRVFTGYVSAIDDILSLPQLLLEELQQDKEFGTPNQQPDLEDDE